MTSDALIIFLKVHGFAKTIGEMEKLSPEEELILEIAALTHDIGIRNSEWKYGSAAGPYQETEGPPEARVLLLKLGFGAPLVDRVCWLIAHHHTYRSIEGRDHAILIEADFLVNAFEDGMAAPAISSAGHRIFTTATGKAILQLLYAEKQTDA